MRPSLLIAILLIALSSQAQDTSYQGKEFWVGFGHHQFMEGGTNTQNMVLYLSTGSQAATVTITIDSSGNPSLPVGVGGLWKKTYNIPANTVIESAIIPKGTTDAPSPADANYDARLFSTAPPTSSGSVGIFRKKAIHIESDVPIAVYSHIYGTASSGATMLMPVEAWGGLYTSANSKQSYGADCFSWMYVIAKYDNTVIEITPSVKTRAQNLTGLQPGVTKTVTLHKGWIYQILGANSGADADGNGGTSINGLELTGTTIKSVTSPTGYIHPIAVFSGSSRTSNAATCGSGGGDNDMQQHFPRQAMGKIYLTAPFSGSSSAASFGTSVYKLIVFDPTTVITRNGVTLSGLINNTYYTYESNTPDLIQSDKPILVSQFMTGGSCLGTGGLGDPEMVYLSPLSQGITDAVIYRNTKEIITVNYLTLIVPTTALASLTIDGSSTFDYSVAHPQNSNYTIVIKKWTASKAQSIIHCNATVVGTTYGLGSVESYGYNIGSRLNAVNARDASVLPPGFTGVLPLSLLDFTCLKSQNDVILKWNTANETGVDRFELERSLNGREFEKFTTVLSKQTTSASYDAKDLDILQKFSSNPAIYYRLKMIDKDGSYKHSAVVIVKLGGRSITEVKASPNPFTDKLQVQVQTEVAGNAKIIIKDLSGKTVESKILLVNKGSSVIEINTLAKLQKGVYLLNIELNGYKEHIKVVK